MAYFLSEASIRRFLKERNPTWAGLTIEVKELTGGKEATRTVLVTARCRDAGKPGMFRFVVKHLEGRPAREAGVYEGLVRAHAAHMSPKLLAISRPMRQTAILYLEAVRRVRAWSWKDLDLVHAMLRSLADFHVRVAGSSALVPCWSYEDEQNETAIQTLAALDRCRRIPNLENFSRALPALKRLVLSRETWRGELLRERSFSACPIHGDVHTGNAVVRRRDGSNQPVLFDWGRARIGSPFEDISSWLHSVGLWEPEVRQRHDSLLQYYCAVHGGRRFSQDMRAAYWLAGASNALSGALLHHLRAAGDRTLSASHRSKSIRAAHDWLRIIRRADAWSK